jgi:hypothetical protein
MLDDADMYDVGFKPKTLTSWRFGEDDQTFYVTQADIDLQHGWQGTPGAPCGHEVGFVDYEQSDLGIPEWGSSHYSYPAHDRKNWDACYRQCCTADAWLGFVLAARILDQQAQWNHDALFDYQDRYMVTEPSWRSWTVFSEDMWDTYRSQY